MFLEEALNRRLIFVTGKGGVGKSTIAASLAKITSSFRNRTALIELTPDNILYRHFQVSPTTDYIEDLSPHLSIYKIRARHVLEEYINDKFHFKSVYKTFFDNRFVNYFLDATPGFNEFLTMSKLWHLAEHDLTPFDNVIVDAPATGHALALFEVPHIVAEAIHSGPLKHLAAEALDLITNHQKTGIVVVSIPEEMPATEAAHIKVEAAHLDIDILGSIINKTNPTFSTSMNDKSIPEKHLPTIQTFLRDSHLISKNQKTHIDFLKKKFGKKLMEIPLIKEVDDAKISDNIVEIVTKNYGSKNK